MPAWRRVRDTTTGHHYDIPAENLPLPDGVVELKSAPVLDGPGERARDPKFRDAHIEDTKDTRTRETTTKTAPGTPADSKE